MEEYWKGGIFIPSPPPLLNFVWVWVRVEYISGYNRPLITMTEGTGPAATLWAEVGVDSSRGRSIVTGTHGGFMDRDLYKQASRGDVNGFTQVLDKISRETNLHRSEILEQVSPQRNTCLHIAANFGHRDLARFIVKECRHLIAEKNSKGDTALHIAARKNDSTLVKIVLDSCHSGGGESWDIEKAEPLLLRIVNEEKNTALHEALINHFEEIAIVFIKADPQVAYYPNKEGKSPLYLAAEAGCMDVVKVIEKYAVEEDMKYYRDLKGKPAVHGAVAGRSLEMLKKILTMEHVPHQTDEDGKTPIHCAASLGFLEGVCYLLQQPTSSGIYQWDSSGFCPIHIACMRGHVAIVKELLIFSSDSRELLSNHGWNILHVAARYGGDNVVSFLLKEKETEKLINEKDNEGNTPLHLAAMHGHPKVVNNLTWDNRVHLNLPDSQGMTALDLATKHLLESTSSFYKTLTWFALKSAGAEKGKSSIQDVHDRKTKSRSLERSKDWVNTLLLVATLVATVTFAAGFTMPGGYNNSDPSQGMAVMLMVKQFPAFVISNNIAMYSSLIVVLILIWTQVGDFGLVLTALKLATPLLGLALAAMSLAFITGVYLVVSDLHWLAYLVCIMGGICLVPILALYVSFLLLGSYRNRIIRYICYYPFCLMIFLAGTVEPVLHSR